MPNPQRRTRRASLVFAALVAFLVGSSLPAVADDNVLYEPPTGAPVVDDYRPPTTPYGPGNRGLTYDLDPSGPVRAIGDGVVVFAGPVGGTRHVTVRHDDGLRSSYSFLDSIGVRLGQRVGRGDEVGTASTGFHLGVRDGDTYLDPALVFGRIQIRVRLVPHDEPARPVADSVLAEHRRLRDLVAARDGSGVLDRLDAAWDLVQGAGATVVGEVWDRAVLVRHLVHDLSPARIGRDLVVTLWERHRQACTSASEAVAVSASRPAAGGGPGRIALLVGGLGSSSTNAAIDEVDLDALGYAAGNAIRYSYAGGRTPRDGLAADLARLPATDYRSVDTNGDVWIRGRELADLVEAVARARPGAPIDVFAHSLGGLVTRVALVELADRPGGLDMLGHVATIGTPHDGADLATLAASAGQVLHAGADVVSAVASLGLDADGIAVTQLAEHSSLIATLAARGVPAGVSFSTVGARGDPIVTADKSQVRGYPSTIVDLTAPTAHDDLPGAAETTRALALGLAERAPACERFVDAVLDTIVPMTYSLTTDTLSLALLLGPLGPVAGVGGR